MIDPRLQAGQQPATPSPAQMGPNAGIPEGQEQPQDESAETPQVQSAEGPEAHDLFGDEQMASPEEQDTYNRVVGTAMKLTYSPELFSQLPTQLAGNGNPAEGLAKTAAMIVARVAHSVNEAGADVSPEVAFHAGKEIFEDLADLSAKLKIKDYSQDPDAFEGAWFSALDQYRILATKNGDIDPATFQDDWAKLQGMNDDGSLATKLTGLAQRDSQKMGSGQTQDPSQAPQGQPQPAGKVGGLFTGVQ